VLQHWSWFFKITLLGQTFLWGNGSPAGYLVHFHFECYHFSHFLAIRVISNWPLHKLKISEVFLRVRIEETSCIVWRIFKNLVQFSVEQNTFVGYFYWKSEIGVRVNDTWKCQIENSRFSWNVWGISLLGFIFSFLRWCKFVQIYIQVSPL